MKNNNNLILAIIRTYKVYKRRLANYEDNLRKKRELGLFVGEVEIENEVMIEAMKTIVYLVEEAIITLDYEQRLIIEKEFLNKASRHWWKEHFSRSTYYRIRKQAIDVFLSKLIQKRGEKNE